MIEYIQLEHTLSLLDDHESSSRSAADFVNALEHYDRLRSLTRPAMPYLSRRTLMGMHTMMGKRCALYVRSQRMNRAGCSSSMSTASFLVAYGPTESDCSHRQDEVL